MVRGIESTVSGMLGNLNLNDIIANNLANINTPGFKQTLATFKNIENTNVQRIDTSEGYQKYNGSLGTLSVGSTLDSTVFDFKQGNIRQTGSTYDLAIKGDGFFTVRTPQGDAYTRNGSFMRNEKGLLTTAEGYPVLGNDNSPIEINSKSTDNFKVDTEGNVIVNGAITAKLQLVDFGNKNTLEQQGSSLYKVANGQPNTMTTASNYQINQGAIESSNANVVECMVNSINCTKSYEMMQKTMEYSDKTLNKATGELGRIKR